MIYFTLLWTFAAVLLFTNRNNNASRFSGLAAFFAGCGGLADIIKFQLVPKVLQRGNHDLVNTLKYVSGILDSFGLYLAPYFLLIFSIAYSELFNSKKKYISYIVYSVLFVPILFMYAHTTFSSYFQTSYLNLFLWATPYFLGVDFLLVYALLVAKEKNIKKQRFIICLLIAPLVTVSYVVNYVGLLFKIGDNFIINYNDIVGLVTLLGFVILAVRYGFLGIKIDVSNIDNQMRIATMGTNLINHALKNEITKINICITNISSYIESNQITKDSMQIIDDSFKHLYNMMSRIQEKTQTIILKEEPCNLLSIIDSTFKAIGPLLQDRNIEMIKQVEPGIVFLCDPVHLEEVLVNIFKNAIEAIPASKNGRIEVESIWRKRQMILEIRDNGSGIPKEVLPHVFKPFFSTKHPVANFGLGLAYSLNVMQKSGGTLEIFSESNVGTTVSLKFPILKLVRNPFYNNKKPNQKVI